MAKRQVIPERIVAARKLTGLSLDRFLELTGSGVNRQSLTYYEHGTVSMKPEYLPPFARVMGVPESFFMGGGAAIDRTNLRKSAALSGVPESDLRILEEMLALLNERQNESERQGGRQSDAGHLKCYNKTPEEAAAKLRRMWDLGTAPITSVVDMLQSHAVRVFLCPMPDKMPAVSTYCDRKHPVIALNARKGLMTNCRTRLAALHELGRLVLTIPRGQDPEPLCGRFAACMLLPKEALVMRLGESCGHLPEEDVARIHGVYGIPVPVLVNHAYDCGIIPQEERDRWLDIIGSEPEETRWGDYPVDERRYTTPFMPVTDSDVLVEKDLREAIEEVMAHTKGETELPLAKDIVF